MVFNKSGVFIKQVYLTYLYIHVQVYLLLFSESLGQFEQVFNENNNIYLILIILFIVIVFLGFIIIFIPFLFYQHKMFVKIKNMLSIIPSELFNDIPKIINLLGIENPPI